ncbi:MAG: FAD-dependent oxidoreductase [Candidatus Kariarchaeaceae archaeon]
MKFDAVIIGGGITGVQSAIDIADQGYQVAILEREPSIGGKMVTLAKVFPTNDCSACIATPLMSSANSNPNITILTNCDVEKVHETNPGYRLTVTQKPRFVSVDDCIGCTRCADVCPVVIEDPWEYNLGVRKAIQVPFETAIPGVAVLIPELCTFCGKCAKVCPTECIDYLDKPKEMTIHTKTLVLATGYELGRMDAKRDYHGDEFSNVIHSLQMERIMAPNGHYGGLLRPSDGKRIRSIAFVLCAGSRDKSIDVNIDYCSRVCCMYSIKQANLLAEKIAPENIYLFYMDIRSFGKGYDEYYQATEDKGINFVKGKVAKIRELPNGNLMLRYEDIERKQGVHEQEVDMVVLALGMIPSSTTVNFPGVDLGVDKFFASAEPKINPSISTQQGIFIAGAAAGPKDIVDSIAQASSAAMKAGIYLMKEV